MCGALASTVGTISFDPARRTRSNSQDRALQEAPGVARDRSVGGKTQDQGQFLRRNTCQTTLRAWPRRASPSTHIFGIPGPNPVCYISMFFYVVHSSFVFLRFAANFCAVFFCFTGPRPFFSCNSLGGRRPIYIYIYIYMYVHIHALMYLYYYCRYD